MKVKVDPSLMSLSGRWTRKDNTVIALNKKTGKMHQYVMNDEQKYPNTTSQQQVTAVFTARAKAASTWWNANKPSTSNANGTADYIKVKAAYDAQRKYGNIFHYVRSLVCGTTPAVAVPGATTTGGGTSTGGGISD